MNVVLKNAERCLISLCPTELDAILEALNLARDSDFLNIDLLESLSRDFIALKAEKAQSYQTALVCADAASVMIKAITVFGDPVEMSTLEAARFVAEIELARSNAM